MPKVFVIKMMEAKEAKKETNKSSDKKVYYYPQRVLHSQSKKSIKVCNKKKTKIQKKSYKTKKND